MFRGAVCGILIGLLACATPDPGVPVTVLRGTAYQRGVEHGRVHGDRIRSFYTLLLTNSLMPYLNRERPDVASVLTRYLSREEGREDTPFQQWRDRCLADCTYNCSETCGFSYLLMKESAARLKAFIPQEALDEMQGIADGAGLPFEKVLILNTFFDTLLSFRAITAYIRQSQAPMLVRVEVPAAAGDGRDNDEDGQTDEEGEGLLAPFEPFPHATWVEVPGDGPVRLRLHDIKLSIGVDKGDEPGVDPATVQIRYNGVIYRSPEDRPFLQTFPVEGDRESLDVVFAPPGGFPPASIQVLEVQAGDFNRIVRPPPVHARFMREERIAFTTAGAGLARAAVPNRAPPEVPVIPPSIAFAARGRATSDGRTLLAQHFALLDSNASHRHATVFVHLPEEGIPYAILGYPGLVWGLAGLNAEGLAWTFTLSDSLNNPMVEAFLKDLFEARLLEEGVPIGILGRQVLSRRGNTAGALEDLVRVKASFGWNVLVADRDGDLAAVEMDTNLQGRPEGGAFVIRPPESDAAAASDTGSQGPSVGPDDLRIASHFQRNRDDLTTRVLVFDIRPQRTWSTFWYRSIQAHGILGEQIAARYGRIDRDEAVAILRQPALVDPRDSMIASVMEPAQARIWYAMGQVPATDGEFFLLDLRDFLPERGSP
ncbi:MAG TPA: carcinine hydrolase/isopenicillin-N N-acyltransferase family protein [Myxococcota bacterium]|nr:carcinine hydrolase/isopenicillin-N N-acyltransferase family protein [Myxococcota bacterium]HQK52069.1 carcinine hydrolase/isopenicillin-N N-acyltransferase family protein [Myxococcota bacterium]